MLRHQPALAAWCCTAVAFAASAGCGGTGGETACGDGIVRPSAWRFESHCKNASAGYDEVFAANVLHRIDLVMSGDDYARMLADLDENYAGTSGVTDLDALPKPIEVPVTVRYDGDTWSEVGMRWKGHASLKGAWALRVKKLSFNLKFDAYEDTYPQLKNQRFWGFKKLAFSSGYHDPSLIRDKTAKDIFRAAGVPAPRAAFAPVYLDAGSGPVYLGLYTMVENPADRMLESQLGGAGGNLYKPWGTPARWLDLADEDATQVEAYFTKKTNETTSDWSDALIAIARLHADLTDLAAWRAGLEAVFDVQEYLRQLAANQVMVNWDSYGCKNHNYYVYASPAKSGRFEWIPWDHNEALKINTSTGCPTPGTVMLEEIVNGDPSDTTATINANWPLIRLLLKDTKYRADYIADVREVLDGAFAEDATVASMQADHDLVAPYVVGPTETEAYPYSNNTSTSQFTTSLTGTTNSLQDLVRQRHIDVPAALEGL